MNATPTPKSLSILGSTGSIGTQTLDVVRRFPEAFRVVALTAHTNVALLAEQARAFDVAYAVIGDEGRYRALRDALVGTRTEAMAGKDGLCTAASLPSVDTVVAAVVGFAGLTPVLAALEAGKQVALANKETLVVAGSLVSDLLQSNGSALVPIDSEHSAIFQCLVGEPEEAVEELVLTASGGPFRTWDAGALDGVTSAEALQHPNWEMGPKITIDSATMMNKGLEVVEAHWLFGLPPDRIRVLVHPQSIIHSMVTFADGSTKAQLGCPDMRVPIQYALSYPERLHASYDRIDWTALRRLDFEQPDHGKFPCLRLAYEALEAGGTAPAILNAANEQAVALFLEDRIRFTDIASLVQRSLDALADGAHPSLDNLVEADAAARRLVLELRRNGTI